MANTTIDALDSIAELSGSEELMADKGEQSVKITASQIAGLNAEVIGATRADVDLYKRKNVRVTYGAFRRGGFADPFTVYTPKDGKKVAWIDRTGRMYLPGGIAIPKINKPRRSGYSNGIVGSILRTPGGKAIYSYDEYGRAILALAPIVMDEIAAHVGASGYVAPAAFSTAGYFHTVRDFQSFQTAVTQDEYGFVYEVKRMTANEASLALITNPAPLKMGWSFGQSTAGDGGETGVIYSATPFPNTVVTGAKSDGGILEEAYGSSPFDVSSIVDFAAAHNRSGIPGDGGTTGQMPCIVGALAIEHHERVVKKVATGGRACFASWYGDQPLNTFLPGTDSYNNLLNVTARFKEISADNYGRGLEVEYIDFCQGENTQTSGTWAGLFPTLYPQIIEDVQAVTGQAEPPIFIFQQIATADNSHAPNGNETAQLNIAKSYEGSDSICLMGPRYQYPLGDDDTIHPSPLGKLMEADTLAYVRDQMLSEGSFSPLWHTGATLVGSDIIITLNKSGLLIDSDWVLSVPNFGFVYSDSMGSATITDIDVSVPGQITVHLSAAPTGSSKKIEYAMITADDTPDHWSNGRGLIYSPTDFPSFYHGLGFAVPETARNYLCRFSVNL